MTSASYGRMRLGRCIRGDFNLGCSNDVVTHFDALCTGRKFCDVSVRSLVDMRPCQRDFASYLEAAFKCIAGQYSSTVKRCAVVLRLACWTSYRGVQGSNPGLGRDLVRDFC